MKREDISINNFYNNTQQNVIKITEDRLELRAREYEEHLKIAGYGASSIGVFLSTLTAILTSDFKDTLLFSGDIWKAIFCVISVLCVFIMLYSYVTYWRKRSEKNFIYNPRTFIIACREGNSQDE